MRRPTNFGSSSSEDSTLVMRVDIRRLTIGFGFFAVAHDLDSPSSSEDSTLVMRVDIRLLAIGFGFFAGAHDLDGPLSSEDSTFVNLVDMRRFVIGLAFFGLHASKISACVSFFNRRYGGVSSKDNLLFNKF